jgi:hypothetical protein
VLTLGPKELVDERSNTISFPVAVAAKFISPARQRWVRSDVPTAPEGRHVLPQDVFRIEGDTRFPQQIDEFFLEVASLVML